MMCCRPPNGIKGKWGFVADTVVGFIILISCFIGHASINLLFNITYAPVDLPELGLRLKS